MHAAISSRNDTVRAGPGLWQKLDETEKAIFTRIAASTKDQLREVRFHPVGLLCVQHAETCSAAN